MDIAECYQDNYSVYNQRFFLDILFAYTVFFIPPRQTNVNYLHAFLNDI